MRFIIGGQPININRLGGSVDDQFIALHSAYLGNGVIALTDFENASFQFFSANKTAYSRHDAYFENFTFIWNGFLASRDYEKAQEYWTMALEPALRWEKNNPGKRIHKGTPYYFWGMTALISGDLDKGYALMHQAVDEDTKSSGKLNPRSPAYLFVSLDYANPNQAFLPWLRKQMRYLDERQNSYSTTFSRRFILDDFRTKFLLSPPSLDIVFSFAFTVARLMRLSEVPKIILMNQFASQLETNLLFDLIQIIDGAILFKNPTQVNFGQHAEYLLGKVGPKLTGNQLGEVNTAKDVDFDKTIGDLLDGTFSLKGGSILSRVQSDVSLSYAIRNRGAHGVSAAPIISLRFHEIEQALLNVLYMTVDFLY